MQKRTACLNGFGVQRVARRTDGADDVEFVLAVDGFAQAALDRGVFGAPSYVIGEDIFWGQDRLEFVEMRLAKG